MTGSSTQAGEGMREAVARITRSWTLSAGAQADAIMALFASELARLTAERDEAARRHAITETEACSRAADAEQSEKHRNDLMDAIVSLKTERGALRSRLAVAEAALTTLRADHAAKVARKDAEIARLKAALRPFAKAAELFGETLQEGCSDACVYSPAAGPDYCISGNDLRRARAALANPETTDA